MKTIELLKNLEKYAVFDARTFRQLAGASPEYAAVYIHRLKRKGYIRQLQKNKYTVQSDPLAVASRIVWPSYISLWSAIRYHNLTEQLPQDVWVVTARKLFRKSVRFGNAKMIFVNIKPKYFFGYRKIMISGFEAFVAEPEKAVLDGILLRKISLSEIAEVIKKNIKTLDIKTLAKFALETENKSLIKRLGFLLDKLGLDYHSKFKKHISDSFVPLEYALPAEGEKNGKWKVIVNAKI